MIPKYDESYSLTNHQVQWLITDLFNGLLNDIHENGIEDIQTLIEMAAEVQILRDIENMAKSGKVHDTFLTIMFRDAYASYLGITDGVDEEIAQALEEYGTDGNGDPFVERRSDNG